MSFTTAISGLPVAPTVTTTATPITVTHHSAIIEGTVLSDGGAAVIERGICRGLLYNPDSSSGICVSEAPLGTEESFEIEISGLTPDTLYHVRAYAKNSAGKTGYGEDASFYTEYSGAVTDPTVIITSISGVSSEQAVIRGKITANGGASISDKGICWSKSPEDPMFGQHISSHTGGDEIEAVITGLESDTKYYVRAYAANSAGNTGYSAKEYFIASDTALRVTTVSISDVTKYSANVSGNVAADAGTVIVEKGVCWGETSPVTVENKEKYYASGIGGYEVAITGLNPETKYYARAYAINEKDEILYGSPELSFTTLPNGGTITAPTVQLSAVASVTSGGATVLGQIIADGGSPITAKGFCWATSENPTLTMCLGYTDEGEGGGSGTSFTSLITGLKPLTQYYVRAYAKNSAGRTGYGDPQFTFTTTDGGGSGTPTLTVTTTAIVSIAPDGATVRGNVSSDSSAVITEKGFYCSETSPPTLDDKKWVYAYSGSGDFEVKITGLECATKYYVVAYAKNAAGNLLYGVPQLSFITSNCDAATAPRLIMTSVTEIKSDSAYAAGKIVSDGGASVTAKGFCWSRQENPTLDNCIAYTDEGGGMTDNGFASLISGLSSGTGYYVSAYAINAAGKTGYADPQFFFTMSATLVTPPTLATVAVNSVTLISATVTGKIISDGGASVTAKGFCWSMLENPTLNNCFGYTNEGGATADRSFTGMITGLSSGTTYYVRAYATNSGGKTGYGDPQLSFNTNTDDTVILTQLSDITYQGAKISGKVLLSNVAEAGICYSETSPPTVDDKKLKALSSAIGNFELTLTGLNAATKYYVRPYAIDSKGNILYGLPQLSFVTAAYADGDESPTVTTLEVRDVTSVGATVTGKVVSDGGYSVMTKGFCWSTWENPTPENCLGFTEEEGGVAGIPFTSLISGMIPDTKYYVRAYAVNSAGKTGYGYPQFSFITKSVEVRAPTVVTSVVNGVTSSTATVTGKVLSDGGASLTAKGFCWGLSENPTPATCLGYTNEGGGTAGFSFTSSITGLNALTSYYVRAYATNSKGMTGYGDPQLSFTTLSVVPLLVTTDSVTAVKWDGATVRGKIASDITSVIIERGVCCSETSPPTLDSKWKAASAGPGAFEISVTGLKPVTQYYVRVYAIDSNGNITYGKPQLSFVTDQADPVPPTVETLAVNQVTETGATVTGKIVSDGGAAITKKGFCWGLSENPTLDKCLGSADQGAGETGVSFTGAVSGLSPKTTYYVRAFATNSAGKTGYGASLSFTTEDTPVITYPVVSTLEVIPVALNAVTVNGKVVSDGGAAITAKGFCWGLSENPTTDDCLGYTNESGGSTDGSFTSSVTGLSCYTKYYIRAYAINNAGKTGYGNSLSFSIPCIIPSGVILRTSFIGEVTGTGATIRASVTLNDGAAIKEKGICYSESSPPTIDNKWADASPDPGDFEIKIKGLRSDTKYYIRAYAIDADGKTLYYEEQQFPFTTLDTEFPTVETVKVTDIGTNSATAQGRILSDGGAAITAKGFCWAISKNPTPDNCLGSTNQGAGMADTFTGSITGLTPDTTYYVRAYTTNSAGKTGYGSDLDFTTLSVSSGLKGDVDKNGIVNIGDAILILKVLTGKSASGIYNMDVNGDNMLGIADVIYIFRDLSKQTM